MGIIIRELEDLINMQRETNSATNHIVMSESVYIQFRGEVFTYSALPYGFGDDITSYKGISIIRLDLPLSKDVLLVG